MNIKSILVSQPKPNSETSPYAVLEKDLSVSVDFQPFIKVEGLTAKDLRQQKIDLSKFTGIVLTSKNAVDHFFRVAEEMRFHVPDAMKYYCQSEAVAFYLQKYIVYRKRKVYIGGKTFADLKPILKKLKKEKLLLPSSNILKPEVPALMNELGLDWKRGIMYQTVSCDLADKNVADYDILVFFSPLGIKSLFNSFPNYEQGKQSIAVFGKSTLKEAEERGLKVNIKVPTPETPSMSMALEDFVKEHNQ
ncbi:uroporphyrinogen-III synthase [Ornithobacterium rhinotracheale]|uniref:uroporphyrinogen-III synthase n=1 Tax=Ornithobacterium rhinotracheale TaxID=28251 RepID=UPI00129C87C4|nr:uroporphyrinogen-III synthase [Ornithobacterium rhinotracheale]MRI63726.1 uroporphyrinogen-III synthase [Ornithobacterium rhinotracheale]MRJ09628.1 uroporphyrinogen-III synthase [Ornithobacterium rhinotracheale]